MEALQMLKFHLKKERLDFTAAWVTIEKEMIDDDLDKDLFVPLLGDFLAGLDGIIKSTLSYKNYISDW